VNFNKLKSLMYVAELGSVNAAAAAMHLTQAAVSQHLKDLEAELELVLVNRSRRPVTLTKDGEELVSVTRQMLKQWNRYQERKHTVGLGGNLVLGHVRSAITGIVAKALVSLRAKHPRLTIKLVTASGVSRLMAVDVLNRKIDAYLGTGPLRLSEELLWRPYCQERFYVIASRKYQGMTDEELLQQGCYIRHKPLLLDDTILDVEMRRRGIVAEPIMELESYDGILLMVEHDAGVGIVPDPYLSTEKFDDLYCVPFGNPPFVREMGLMVRSDSPNLFLVDLLWESIKGFSTASREPPNRAQSSK
jgi:DNA-binding transcriptional LysR family regulator